MTLFDFDNEYRKRGYVYLAGTDEAGRGPLAGPVFAAAVILPPKFYDERINDSKKLSEKNLIELSDFIKENALSYALVKIDAPVIDEINIYQASKRAMEEALSLLTVPFDFILTDAMPLAKQAVGHEALIKGDALSLSIAASSILAKVARDTYMKELHKEYPQYHFDEHKGYGTKKHLAALREFGPLPNIHRYTYKPVQDLVNEQISLF